MSEEIVAVRLQHAIDLLRAEIKALAAEIRHTNELYGHRITQLEKSAQDHETRLRQVQDTATQFKVLAGLATGGGLLSVIALLKALITP